MCEGAVAHSLLLASLGSLDVDLDSVGAVVTVGNLCVELELHALLGQQLLDVLGDFGIHTRATYLAEELDDGDFGAKARPDRSHLQTDDAATNDNHLLGDFLQGNGAGAGNDLFLVNGEAGEGRGLGAGGDDDVLAADRSLATVNKVDLDGVLVGKGTGALDVFDVVLLEQELDTLGEAGNRRLLGLHHLLEVELDIADLDTAVLGVVQDLVVEMRVVQQRLGGDAADVETGAAQYATLFYAGDL